MKGKRMKKTIPVRNPNRRPCVASNITFRVQEDNIRLLRILNRRSLLSRLFKIK